MQIHQFEFRAMASPCEIKLGGMDQEAAKNIARAAELEVRRIEDKYSRFKTDNMPRWGKIKYDSNDEMLDYAKMITK